MSITDHLTTKGNTMKNITLHDNVSEVVRAMQSRVDEIGLRFGEHSPEAAKAASSLSRALSGLMLSGFSNTAEVSRDGELSLYVTEGGFAYGIIFHPDRGAADRKLAAHGVENVAPEVRALYEIAGTWSMHS